MGRIKRGGYIFQFWMGDHDPPHVHVWQHGRMIAKVKRDESLMKIKGKINRKIRKILMELLKEGIL